MFYSTATATGAPSSLFLRTAVAPSLLLLRRRNLSVLRSENPNKHLRLSASLTDTHPHFSWSSPPPPTDDDHFRGWAFPESPPQSNNNNKKGFSPLLFTFLLFLQFHFSLSFYSIWISRVAENCNYCWDWDLCYCSVCCHCIFLAL